MIDQMLSFTKRIGSKISLDSENFKEAKKIFHSQTNFELNFLRQNTRNGVTYPCINKYF